MKINKLILILTLIAAFSLSACANDSDDNTKNQVSEENKNNEKSNQFNAQGRIIKIDKEGIHIQNKDKVDVYKVGEEKANKFYAGEYVGINKLNTGDYEVLSDVNYDYNKRFTSEGNEIRRTTGTVKDFSDGRVTAVTESGNLDFVNPDNISLAPDSQVIFDYVEMNGGNQIVSYYDEKSKIVVKVKEISRGTDGTMKVFATAADNKEYDINVGADAVTNFAHSSLKVGDEITVYPETVTGNIPAVVDAKLIVKK